MNTHVLKSFEAVDNAMASIQATAGNEIACKGAGCFWCCKEPVTADAEEVAHLLCALTADERIVLAKRTAGWLIAATKAGVLEDETPNAFTYRSHNIWCPLLELGHCTAYANRPVACRAHAARSTNEGCRDDALRPQQQFLLSVELVGTALIARLDETKTSQRFSVDHLGAWLARFLLGVDVHSRTIQVFEITSDQSPAPTKD